MKCSKMELLAEISLKADATITNRIKHQMVKETDQEQYHVDKLYEKYQPRLRNYIKKHVDNESDMEDILQDIFYQLIKTVDNTLNPIEHVSAWLYKVARNTIINKRNKKKEKELVVYQEDKGADSILSDFSEVLFNNDSSPSPEMEYLSSLVWTELENALSELPIEQQEVFRQTELYGVPIKDISQDTGVPVNTLLSRKHYAVLHLRKKLSDLYEAIIQS